MMIKAWPIPATILGGEASFCMDTGAGMGKGATRFDIHHLFPFFTFSKTLPLVSSRSRSLVGIADARLCCGWLTYELLSRGALRVVPGHRKYERSRSKNWKELDPSRIGSLFFSPMPSHFVVPFLNPALMRDEVKAAGAAPY